MLTFENVQMASRSFASGGNSWAGRHKDICALLGKWRRICGKDGSVSADSLDADILAFLQQGR